jgi:hypothetical protein
VCMREEGLILESKKSIRVQGIIYNKVESLSLLVEVPGT